MSAHCDHCDLPAATCAHSPRALAAEAAREPVVDGPTITSVCGGTCAHCGEEIVAGHDSITHTDMGWVLTDHVPGPTGPPSTPASLFEGF